MRKPAPRRVPTRQERLATWLGCGIFFSSLVPLMIERIAFDNTLGQMWLVAIGVAAGLLLALPLVVFIRRMDFASRDRWAACIFLVLGLCGWGVPATTWINRAFAPGAHHVEALQVLEKHYASPTRNSMGPQYWLRLAYQGQDTWIIVESDEFERATAGKPQDMDVVRGAFGLPVIDCAKCF